MLNRTGIVLKKISPHKVAMLDEQVGRVDAVTLRPPPLGALVHYSVERERGTLYFLDRCSTTDLPFFLGSSDILFWHHVLELSYFFMPVGSYASQLFELLSFLYTVEKGSCWGACAKKLYLFKLLSTIGIQAEIPQIPASTLYRFMAMPPAQMSEEVLSEESEKILDEWLRVCVAEHPAIEQFKTVHFLAGE